MLRSKGFIILIGIVALSLAGGGLAFADHQIFNVPLETAKAMPYGATGSAQLILSADGSTLDYSIDVLNVYDPTTAVLEYVPAGSTEGEIVAWLEPTSPVNVAGPTENEDATPLFKSGDVDFMFSGGLANGTITASSLVGSLSGKWDSFVQDLKAGRVYLTVNSAVTPDALTGTIK